MWHGGLLRLPLSWDTKAPTRRNCEIRISLLNPGLDSHFRLLISESLLTDAEIAKDPLSTTLFPGVSSSVEV